MGTSQSRKRLIGGTALTEAASSRDIDLVGRLIAEGADVNAQDNYGWTALMYAAGEGYADLVRLLLAARANVNAQTNNDWTALMDAAREGHAEIVRLLLAAGADVNAQNNDGTTALMMAERRGHTDVVRAINSFLAAQAMNRWIPRHRSRQRDRVGLSELDRGTTFMDLVYYHTQGFL